MIQFMRHDGFEKEQRKLSRRFHGFDEGLKKFERICQTQFHPTLPRSVIGPGKLHRLTENTIWTLWKIELVIPGSGLRQSQFPRLWFAVKGDIIAFLCIGAHADNYDDNTMDALAIERATEIF